MTQLDRPQERLIATYRKKAKHYDVTSRLYPVPGYPQRGQRLRTVQALGLRAGDTVVDVACGTGVVAITAARLGAKVTGLDLTPELLERARYAHLNALPRHLPAPIHALGSECSPRWSEPVPR